MWVRRLGHLGRPSAAPCTCAQPLPSSALPRAAHGPRLNTDNTTCWVHQPELSLTVGTSNGTSALESGLVVSCKAKGAPTLTHRLHSRVVAHEGKPWTSAPSSAAGDGRRRETTQVSIRRRLGGQL